MKICQKIIALVLFIGFLSSCENKHGNQIVGDHLVVFYTQKNDGELAKKIAIYWKENNLITGIDQHLQLFRSTDNLQLRLISLKEESREELSFTEYKLLLDLQNELRRSLGVNDFNIVICDDDFNPYYALDN